jgi:antirestriction protein ArdC
MKRDEVSRIAREAFDQLVKDVDAGKSETLNDYLKSMGRFHRYILGNAILIHLQRPDAIHVAGFRAWERLGRHVRKGEHGIAIMAPVVYGRKARRDDGDHGRDADDEAVFTFKTAYVFDVSQTEGKPLPQFARARGNPGVYLTRLERFIADRGIELQRSDSLTMAEGVSIGGTILVKACLAPAEEFSVLVHETAHELMHYDKRTRPPDKRVREAEAEAVAYVVCQGVGLDVNTASSDYIQLYDGDRKTLMRSLERIQRTATKILAAVTGQDEILANTTIGDQKGCCQAPSSRIR